MKDLQEAATLIFDLKGNILALETLLDAILTAMTPDQREDVLTALLEAQEISKVQLLGAVVSETTVTAHERDVQRVFARWGR